MTVITPTALGNNLPYFSDHLYVGNRQHLRYCECDVLVMHPEHAANLAWPLRMCIACRGVVTYERNDDFNRYWGFSGYDEYPDIEPALEDYDE